MYVNAQEILPPQLLEEVQRYVQGKEIYIPKDSETRLGWGQRNGTRRQLEKRNSEIRSRYRQGQSISVLADQFHLSYDSIRKIVSGTRRS